MPSQFTRRHVLASAAVTAAVAAMPAAAIAVVEEAHLAGWTFVVNEATRPLLARLPSDLSAERDDDFILYRLFDETYAIREVAGPHRWIGAKISGGMLRVVGDETWSRRQAMIDAGWPMEPRPC